MRLDSNSGRIFKSIEAEQNTLLSRKGTKSRKVHSQLSHLRAHFCIGIAAKSVRKLRSGAKSSYPLNFSSYFLLSVGIGLLAFSTGCQLHCSMLNAQCSFQPKFCAKLGNQGTLTCSPCAVYLLQLREGCRKKNAAKVWSFTKPGGVSEGNKKPNPFFGKVFFQ